LNQVRRQKFNGISLFAVTGGTTNSGTLYSNTSANYNYEDSTGAQQTETYSAFSRIISTHPSGVSSDGSISLNVTNLTFVLTVGGIESGASSVNLLGLGSTGTTVASGSGINANGFVDSITEISISQFTQVIEKVADARAENGAEQQRMNKSYELHQTNLVNIEAAHGRIMDVDVALESTRFAKNNVLVQASASMTAQANQLTQVALTLLQ